MAPLPTSMQHFNHHQHPIILHDDTINPKYLCEGCMTYGFGKRYHCHSCTFNLHEYCATCPRTLSSFMHPHHSLRLVERNHQLGDRVCNICRDLIEGLSYRCELCEFDVHPICSQLPEALKHILHQRHPLRLLSSIEPGTCAVCRGACNPASWRYRCALCGFDIHIGCVPTQCEKKVTTIRGIPTYVPPSKFSSYAYETPTYVPPSTFPQQYYFGGHNSSPNHFPGPSNNMHHYNYNMPQHQGHGQAQTHHGGRIGQVMFTVVKAIITGVISNMIFGVDVTPFLGF